MEHLLKKLDNLNQRKRKGFTLVELLVVIAILAVLASVSVVGYLGFTNKAKHNNALSELKQAKEVIRASLVDGDTHYYDLSVDGRDTGDGTSSTNLRYVVQAKEVTKDYYFGKTTDDNETEDNVKNGFTIQYSNDDLNAGLVYDGKAKENYVVTWDSLLKALFTDLSSLNGYFYAVTDTNGGPITALKYYSNNNGKAMWTIKDDSLTSGDDVGTEEESNTINFTIFQKDGIETGANKGN